MKIKELIWELHETLKEYGDIECLIEVPDDTPYLMPVDELNVEDREGYGISVSLIS